MTNNEKYSFENFIMQCCKAREWNLRRFLKKTLIEAGFTIEEDDYISHRGDKTNTVHNMLAIRGNPRVCLVAHTDVCRDHAYGTPNVDPVIKVEHIKGKMRSIIQDRDCNVQVGGDDRLGVAINTWIALNTGYDVGLLFTTDEEVGLISAEYATFPKLLEFDLLVQVDRGNYSNQLVNAIGSCKLCSDTTAARLLKIAEDIDLPRFTVNGMMTDVLAIKGNNMCKEAVNMTCGYHNSYGAEKDEFIDIQEAKDTMQYVSTIIQYYYLDKDKGENIEIKSNEDNSEVEFIDYPIVEHHKRNRNKNRKYYSSESDDLWSEERYKRDKEQDEYRDDWVNYLGN